ncbi:alpha/beta hydrolase [Anaerocolumna sp. MB42-C2]|uniref:alpha/beta hydrolase n=1 Tax=Anaerocolumna sp. MB42-C2 TaxID=3070997 RepID=UPI0027DF2C2F|nr:alpha/beta hydrolase family protein [Anaerocolumna sp. MB42-C2]WMJ89484.1 alpha/beta hydrolase family protein [Anaerocolumna sp. MB42-C2]
MALMHVDFFSNILGLCCEADVILPQKKQGIGMEGSDTRSKYPVLWLLHGASDDHTIWQRRTSIERYVSDLGLAVVMPGAGLSYYTNMAYGPSYFDYIAEELPEIMRSFFPISDRREDNFVCGLSMGGYGAMKIGLTKPDHYSAIGCFSAGNFAYRDVRKEAGSMSSTDRIKQNMLIFGVEDMLELKNTEHDLFYLAEKNIKEEKPLPKIYQTCGNEDFLVENARVTADWFQQSKYDFTYMEGPGAHTWEFWDEWIQKYLGWLKPNLR